MDTAQVQVVVATPACWSKSRCSRGRVGACGDNAAMETFFSLLQKNVLDRQRRLGRLTPIESEAINTALQAA